MAGPTSQLPCPAHSATVATGIVRVLGTFAPLAFLGAPLITRSLAVSYGQLLAIATIVLIAFINWIGVERAGEFQLFFTVLKIGIILVIVVAGFSYHGGAWHNFSTSNPNATVGFAGFMAALLAALWAYDGWNLVTTVSGEIRDPQRSLPIALVFGVGTVGILYYCRERGVAVCDAGSAIAGSPQPASTASALVLGRWGAGIVSVGMASHPGMSQRHHDDRRSHPLHHLSRPLLLLGSGTGTPSFRTPSTAIAVQTALAVALMLSAQSFQQLFSLTSVCRYVFYIAATASVFVFRVRNRCLAPVPHLGIPGGTRPVHRRFGDPAVLLIPRTKVLAGGDWHDSGWRTLLSLFRS